MRRKFYIAYGSNLNFRQMRMRCPQAKPVGSVILEDYELLFHGVATIAPKAGSSVPCGLWLISKKDEIALDRYEGWPNLYRKEKVEVQFGKRQMQVMTYIMNTGSPHPPTQRYHHTILQGYWDFDLDMTVLTEAVRKSKP